MPELKPSPSPLDSPTSLGDKIDAYWEMKNTISVLSSQLKAVQDDYRAMETDLIHALTDQELTGSQGHLSRCSINEREMPQVDDMDTVYAFIEADFDERRYLLQRRISSTAFKELKTILGEDIPGLSTFTKRTINIRKLN